MNQVPNVWFYLADVTKCWSKTLMPPGLHLNRQKSKPVQRRMPWQTL